MSGFVDLVELAASEKKEEVVAVEAEAVEAEPVAEEVMVEMKAQRVTFLSDAVIIHNDNGMDKTISLSDFADSFKAAYTPEDKAEGKPFTLPQGCRKLTIGSDTITVTCYYPPNAQDVHHISDKRAPQASKKKYHILVPAILITFKLERGKADGEWVVHRDTVKFMCTSQPFNTLKNNHYFNARPSEGVYVLPFANIYSDGRMCYGDSTVMPTTLLKNNLMPLDYYYKILFEAPFNNDLSIAGVGVSTCDSWWTKLETCLKEGKPFPYNDISTFEI